MIFSDNVTDEDIANANSTEMLTAALAKDAEAAPGFVEVLVNGLIRGRPALVVQIAQRLGEAVLHVGGDAKFTARCISEITEALNKAGHHPLALSIALTARRRLDETGPWTDQLTRATARFLNELGNCHRYAGEFELALRCYDKVLAFLPDDIEDFDRRVLEANRAIVLRSVGQFEEAKNVFQRLFSNANDSERIRVIHSEALCWMLQGEKVRAQELLEQHLPVFLVAVLMRFVDIRFCWQCCGSTEDLELRQNLCLPLLPQQPAALRNSPWVQSRERWPCFARRGRRTGCSRAI